MATYEIPVEAGVPAQRFQLPLQDKIYWFELTFNTRMGRWLMDIENETLVPLVRGIPLLTGMSLLDGYTSDALPPGVFVCVDLGNKDRHPDRDNFGIDLKLYYSES